MKKVSFVLFAVLISSIAAFSQKNVTFYNRTASPVFVCVVEQQPSVPAIVRGWYKIVPWEKKVLLTIPNTHGFWYYATSGGRIWEGQKVRLCKFLIDTKDGFSIKHAPVDGSYVPAVDKESNSNYEYKYFIQEVPATTVVEFNECLKSESSFKRFGIVCAEGVLGLKI